MVKLPPPSISEILANTAQFWVEQPQCPKLADMKRDLRERRQRGGHWELVIMESDAVLFVGRDIAGVRGAVYYPHPRYKSTTVVPHLLRIVGVARAIVNEVLTHPPTPTQKCYIRDLNRRPVLTWVIPEKK